VQTHEQEAADRAILAKLVPDHPEAGPPSEDRADRLIRMATEANRLRATREELEGEARRRDLLRSATQGTREAIGALEIAAERYRAGGRGDRAADIDRALEILEGVELR